MYNHEHTFKNLFIKLLDLNNSDWYGCSYLQMVTKGIVEYKELNKYVNENSDSTYNL